MEAKYFDTDFDNNWFQNVWFSNQKSLSSTESDHPLFLHDLFLWLSGQENKGHQDESQRSGSCSHSAGIWACSSWTTKSGIGVLQHLPTTWQLHYGVQWKATYKYPTPQPTKPPALTGGLWEPASSPPGLCKGLQESGSSPPQLQLGREDLTLAEEISNLCLTKSLYSGGRNAGRNNGRSNKGPHG